MGAIMLKKTVVFVSLLAALLTAPMVIDNARGADDEASKPVKLV